MAIKLSDLIQLGSGDGLTLATEQTIAFTASANTVYPVSGGVTVTLSPAIAEGAWVILLDPDTEWPASKVTVSGDGEAFDGVVNDLELTGAAIGAAFKRTATGWDAYAQESATPYLKKVAATLGMAFALGAPAPKATKRAVGAIELVTATGAPIPQRSGAASGSIDLVNALGSPAPKASAQASGGISTVFAIPMISMNTVDPDAQAIIDAVVSGITSAQEAKIVTFVDGMKSDEIWDEMDRIWVTYAKDEQMAKIDWKAPSVSGRALVAYNSPTFTAWQDYKGDGSTAYLDTQFDPADDGVNYTQNDCSIIIGSTQRSTAARSLVSAYDSAGTYRTRIATWPVGTDNARAYLNSAGRVDLANVVPIGLIAGNRTASNAIEAFVDGVSINTDTDASGGLLDESLYILAQNQSFGGAASAGDHSDGAFDICMVGASMPEAKHADLTTLFEAYKAA